MINIESLSIFMIDSPLFCTLFVSVNDKLVSILPCRKSVPAAIKDNDYRISANHSQRILIVLFHRVHNSEKSVSLSAHALREHCIDNLLKTSDIRTSHIVAFHAIPLCCVINIVVNIYHNIL